MNQAVNFNINFNWMLQMVKSKEKPALDALIFIDTNIYLDFYRAPSGFDVSMIKHLERCHDKIITTNQVFMEYMKNRQKVILETLKIIKDPNIEIEIPAFLSSQSSFRCINYINDNKKDLKKEIKHLKTTAKTALNHPGNTDQLYQYLPKIFKRDNQYHLDKENEIKFNIRELAKNRFWQGYPPRKKDDTSYGDAINWEWIMHCASKSPKNIIIVSRDGDYGTSYENVSILNDWLKYEFQERISTNKEIILTDRLSYAFKLIGLNITKKEEKQEEELIFSLNKKLFNNIVINNADYKKESEYFNSFISLLMDKSIKNTCLMDPIKKE